MKKPPRNLLLIFLALSAAAHLAPYSCLSPQGGEDPATPAVTLLPSPKEPQQASEPDDADAAPTASLARYRPTEELTAGQETARESAPGPAPAEKPAPAEDQTPPHETAPEPRTPEAEPEPAETLDAEDPRPPQQTAAEHPAPSSREGSENPAAQEPPTPAMSAAEHRTYRRRLAREFDDDWTRVPDLVVHADPEVQQEVGNYFDMKLIAYPRSEERPSYVVVIDEDTGRMEYTRDFDFSPYSNRIKDRGGVPRCQRLLRRAKSRFALPGELAIVSLVPAEADAYFAAKQIRAVRAAGLSPEEVARTEGRYERAGDDAWCLVITRVVSKNGQVRDVSDPESRSATAGS